MLQVWTLGLARGPTNPPFAVIVGLVPSLVGCNGLRELAMVALFGNYGLTLERALGGYRAVCGFSTSSPIRFSHFCSPGYSGNGSPIRCAAPRFCTSKTHAAISATSIRSAIDLICGASGLSLKIIEAPIRYANRTYGETQNFSFSPRIVAAARGVVCVFAYQSALNWMQ